MSLKAISPENPAWLADRLSVRIILTPGDRRQWDIDNRSKAVLDALEGTWFANDHQVDELSIVRLPADSVPSCRVELRPFLGIGARHGDNHRT